MAAESAGASSNSRLSGTDAKPLKIVTFSEDLSHPGVHHTWFKTGPPSVGSQVSPFLDS